MSRATVLLVEDAAEVALLTQVLLGTLDDVDVVTATDGVEGLAQAHAIAPDLVLLDLTLPLMDGVEVLAELRSDPRLSATRVVLFTGSPGEAEGLHEADGVLAKPFTPDELLACVMEHLERRRAS